MDNVIWPTDLLPRSARAILAADEREHRDDWTTQGCLTCGAKAHKGNPDPMNRSFSMAHKKRNCKTDGGRHDRLMDLLFRHVWSWAE